MANKILFLDRDGTINISGPDGYVSDPRHFHYMPGIFDVCRVATEKGYKIVVITNQTGIGWGNYTERDMQLLHQSMWDKFQAEGVPLTDIFYSTDPDSPYRKPSAGMFLLAKEKYGLSNQDMLASFAIGDREKDAMAALSAGVGNIIYFQSPQVMNRQWQIVEKSAHECAEELKKIKETFQTLAIITFLIQHESDAPKQPIPIANRAHITVINDYRQLHGRIR
ncbi:MAG: HAD-IIIA family hydrolase [Pseudomonadota bacterium]|nr:HAD-IIIA family hydrolase [Pseudomonadota bacterium]